MPATPVIKPPIIDFSTRWDGGIADLSKNSPDTEFAFGRSLDVRTDPFHPTILPRTVKESGGIITDLIKDGDRIGTDLYEYGETGNIYKRTSLGSSSLLHTVPNSHGNGMKYYGEDDYLYYTSDKVIGRYGQVVNGTPTFTDDFLGAEGGIPLNTNALSLVSASSQYADRADTVSLSITGDLAMEAWIDPTTLPTSGNSMVLFSKWDINTNKRSYKFEIYAVAGTFGTGGDGVLTISTDFQEAPIDSAATGTVSSYSLAATNASFAAGQIILIHQTQGTGAGMLQKNKIISYAAGTITLETALNGTYGTGAQVRVMKQYSSVTINAGKTYSAKPWNGTVGGIIAFLCSGTITVNGTVTSTGAGFRGGAIPGVGAMGVAGRAGFQGEGVVGTGAQNNRAGNANGGGAGINGTADDGGGGAGGSHAVAGTNGADGVKNGGATTDANTGGLTGSTVGTTDLTTMVFGGAGGSGCSDDGAHGGQGGESGGITYLVGVTITVNTGGLISSNGNNGYAVTFSGAGSGAGGGAGAGGSVLLKCQTGTFGTSLLSTTGGTGSVGTLAFGDRGGDGGNGSVGRMHLDYLTSYTYTSSTPTLDVAQDNTLVSTVTYQLRLGLSSDGTAEEFLTQNSTVVTGRYFHVGVSWNASGHTATFFQDGNSIGTANGAVTSLNDNTSRPCIGADFNSTARNFYNGLIDEVRVWNIQRTQTDMNNNKDAYISASTPGLQGWWKLNNAYTDATANSNDLAGSNSPTFTTSIPFSAATTRQDLDQGLDTSGNTYTMLSAINEGATHRQTFVPQKDPQKSVEILVANIGTGDWTVTVHDPLNRVIATATITHANMHTGLVEFTFTTAWRPVRGATYHFHAITTTADGTVTTTTVSDFETVDFHTYYQFLVTDTDYHQIEQILNVLAIANGRYVATYSASGGYNPHALVFPSGWRVRCFALWKGFLAIGCTREGAINGTDDGIIFFWDGTATTYNDFLPVPEGAINAMKSYKGKLYISAGYRGEIVVYTGGDSTDDTLKKHIPKIGAGEYIEVMPKAMTVWQGLLRIGVSGTSNAATVERGVYTYGQQLASSPVALTYDHPISTGSRASTSVRIGFLYPIATKLIIGWEDSLAHGTDVVDPGGSPFATATVEKTIKDFARVSKGKKAMVVRAEFDPLRVGETIRLKYRFNRAANWTYGTLVTTLATDHARLVINKGNHRELEYAAELGAATTSPGLLELGVQEDTKPTEQIY